MRIEPILSARFEFARRATISRELQRRFAEEGRKREQEKDKSRSQEQAETELLEFAQMAIMATDSQMIAFEMKLDRYDAATVEALLENERELQIVQERLEQRLAHAVVLPDGRRVFKTEDGQRVMDEFGVEVSPDIISPDEIPDHKDRFEPYWRDHDSRDDLVQERDVLLEYQSKLDGSHERYDQARAESNDNAVSKDFLDDLDAEIEAATPDRVKRILGQAVPEHGKDMFAEREPSAPSVQPVGRPDMLAP